MTHSRRSFLTHAGIGVSSLSVGVSPAPALLPTVQSEVDTNAAAILLSDLYAVVGSEMNVYWDGVIASMLDVDQFRYRVRFSLYEQSDAAGEIDCRQENYRWTIVPSPADVGDHIWQLNVLYNGELVTNRIVPLRIRPVAAAQPRKLLMIGDSTAADGVMLAELVNLLAKTNWDVKLVGSRRITQTDADNVPREVRHESKGGWTFEAHYSDERSRLVRNGIFNLARYLRVNEISLSAGDWIMFNLGINDMSEFTNDDACYAKITMMIQHLRAMIAVAQNTITGIRIGLCVTIPPARDQDAFRNRAQWRYKRNRDLWVTALHEEWQGQQSNGIYLVPIHAALDTRNNMRTASVPANARNPALVVRQSNSVHPARTGYWQIADALFAFLVGQETT